MDPRYLFLDFETRSEVDLRACGLNVYAEHPSTAVLCAAFALGDVPVRLWKRTDGPAAHSEWARLVRQPDVVIVARNAEFERTILREVVGIDLPASKFRCTAAQSARHGLPRSLDASGVVLGTSEKKDKATGSRVIAKLCQPRRPSKANPDLFWEESTAPEDFADLYEYCMQDVRTDRELFWSLPRLSDKEQAVWELTVRMNDRGVKVDTEALPLAISAASQEIKRLAARWLELTKVEHGSVVAGAAALGLPDLTKATVRRALKGDNLDPQVREALEVRQKLARSSVAKLQAFRDRTSRDGRIRGMLVYGGAERTLRWSGMGVQPQNFPRGLGEKTEEAFQALLAGRLNPDGGYADPLGTVADMLRGFFVGPFLAGDYAQIEARGLAWLAGQDDLVAAFARDEDVYSQMASVIFGRPVKKGDKDEGGLDMRFIGKTAVLGCGYGLGAAKFKIQLDDQFGVTVSDSFAQKVVAAYRRRYEKIPAFWYRLEDAFRYAVRIKAQRLTHPSLKGLAVGVRKLEGRSFAFIELPSGRELFYYDPQVAGDGQISYIGRNIYAGGRWERVGTYGGKLTENVVQALSRDALAEAMLRLDAAGFPLVLTVHDEVVAEGEVGESGERMREFAELMAQRPEWAPDLPLAVECMAAGRYRK